MPLYEYVCQSCGKKTETIQKVGARPLRTCLDCGGSLKKAFSAPAIQFKGSGWYVNDYARGSSPGEKSGSGSKSSESGSKSSESGSKSSESSAKDSGEKKESAGKSEPGEAKKKEKEV